MIPARQIPVPNAYDDFVRAGILAKGMKHKIPISMAVPDFTYASFQAAAKDAQPALALLRQGLGKEYLMPPAKPLSAMNVSGAFPVLASFRELARVESGVSIYYEMDGLHANATETRLDALEMGVAIPLFS